jgi:hypothetical protein
LDRSSEGSRDRDPLPRIPTPRGANVELLAAEEAVLDLRKEGGARDEEDEHGQRGDLSQVGTSFLEVEVLEGFSGLAIERGCAD